MALSDTDKLLETETTIRWDALDNIAQMWTADIRVRREWKACGFSIIPSGRGWATIVPANRITYKPLKKG